jgi:hypothetical protein
MGSEGGKWPARSAARTSWADSRCREWPWRGARPICLEERSGNGEAVSVGGFDDEAGCGHGGETFVESGSADVAGSAQFGECPRFATVGESRGDALIHGDRLDAAVGLRIGLDGLQGKCVITLGEFERHTGHSGGGTTFDGQYDPSVAVAAERERERWNRPRRGIPTIRAAQAARDAAEAQIAAIAQAEAERAAVLILPFVRRLSWFIRSE